MNLDRVHAITLFVAGLAAAREFYDRVFGKPILREDPHSIAYGFENIVVNLLVEGEAPGLIGPAPVAPATAGARFQLTVAVEDVDAVCESLRALGVDLLSGPVDRPWGVRTASFADPSGHIWEIAS